MNYLSRMYNKIHQTFSRMFEEKTEFQYWYRLSDYNDWASKIKVHVVGTRSTFYQTVVNLANDFEFIKKLHPIDAFQLGMNKHLACRDYSILSKKYEVESIGSKYKIRSYDITSGNTVEIEDKFNEKIQTISIWLFYYNKSALCELNGIQAFHLGELMH